MKTLVNRAARALGIDEFGHRQCAPKAVDGDSGARAKPYFLHRIDCRGRLLIKNGT